mmetsp:Transcript_8045/g.22338  ORF Transcript_8045/g.22338 Transcript_8045/m.22338 type:complete len:142 (-) Transcript_8045:45-470(-)
MCLGEVFAVLARLTCEFPFGPLHPLLHRESTYLVCMSMAYELHDVCSLKSLQHVVESRISRLTRSSGRGGYRRKSREPQAESGVRRAGLASCRDNFCLFFQCNDWYHLTSVLCFTPKQQSLHSKQKSPPTTHQLGEPPALF